MPRQLDPNFVAALNAGLFLPVFLVDLTFISGTYHLATTPYALAWNGNTYTGTGTLGEISTNKETINIEATGMTVTLSGVDPAILQECLDDVSIGAPATIWFGALNPANPGLLMGAPAIDYQGLIDAPSITTDTQQCSISLAIESRMLRLQSGGQQRRYTSADQRLLYPDDTFFQWVETNNDLALKFGQ